jgi:hypothetical protein
MPATQKVAQKAAAFTRGSSLSNTIGIVTPTRQTQTVNSRTLQADRVFYFLAACTVLIISAVGFRNFYLSGTGFGGNPLTPQVVPLILVHGFAMSSWVILFLVQSALILAGNRRLHMVIGPIGAVLAAAMVVLGTAMAILSAHFNPRAYEMFGGAKFFLIEMLTEILLFGVLVWIAIAYRHRAEIHRPMMLLATAVILSGALARCPYISDLAAKPPLYVYAPVLIYGALLFCLQWGMTRIANRWYAIGYGGVALTFLVSIPLGHSALWNHLLGTYIP